MFSEKSLQELRNIIESDGYHVDDEELFQAAISLYNLVGAVYKPIKKEWLEELK